MPPGEYTTTILPVTDTAKYRKSQFYATNHKSHQNAMSLTDYYHCIPPPLRYLFTNTLIRFIVARAGSEYESVSSTNA